MPNYDFPRLRQDTFLKALGELGPLFTFAGVPYGGAVSNFSGTELGAGGIARASAQLCDGLHPRLHLPENYSSIIEVTGDVGDLRIPHTSLAAMSRSLRAQAKKLVKEMRRRGGQTIFLGGDHSVTFPLLQAIYAVYGPIFVIHFDAHCDTWTLHFGEPRGHGTWVYDVIKAGLVVPGGFVQLGIRSSGERAAQEYVTDQGGRIFTAWELYGREGARNLSSIVDEIEALIAAAGYPPVYISFDIDAVDPAFAPGTGTPEPGGLTSMQALVLMELLSTRQNIRFVGMDLVEVSPVLDNPNNITSLLAAHLIWTFMCGQMACGAVPRQWPKERFFAKDGGILLNV